MELEGIIKYNCKHEEVNLEQLPHFREERLCILFQKVDNLRTKLHDRGYIGVNEDGIGYGNISIRMHYDDESIDHFLVSSTNTGHVRELGLNGYSLVYLSDIENNTVHSMGAKQASSESMTHAAIYSASSKLYKEQNSKERIECIVHIHHAPLFTTLCEEDDIPCTAEDILYGSVDMAKAIIEVVNKKAIENVILMRGHQDGIIFHANSIEDLGHVFGL